MSAAGAATQISSPVERKALELVDRERDRQVGIWGEQNHALPCWIGILGEEYGELCEAISETMLDDTYISKPELGGRSNILEETVQFAAVAVQIMEYILRVSEVVPSREVRFKAYSIIADEERERKIGTDNLGLLLGIIGKEFGDFCGAVVKQLVPDAVSGDDNGYMGVLVKLARTADVAIRMVEAVLRQYYPEEVNSNANN